MKGCMPGNPGTIRTGLASNVGHPGSHCGVTGPGHMLASDNNGSRTAKGAGVRGRGATQQGCGRGSKGGGKRHGACGEQVCARSTGDITLPAHKD